MPKNCEHRFTEGGEAANEPVLRLPADEHRVRQLEAKKTEYEERLAKQSAREPYRHPDLAQDPGTRIRLAILSRLLEAKEVPTWTFSLELASQSEGIVAVLGPKGFEEAFNCSAAVINDYCETGGTQVRGGTGLPEVE